MGGTILEEDAAYNQRCSDICTALSSHNISVRFDDVDRAYKQASREHVTRQLRRSLQILGVSDEIREAIYPMIKWQTDLESPAPGAVHLLDYLHNRYRLGIIANQHPGTESRLEARGWHRYFDIILGSGDIGMGKPDPEIFRMALKMADCTPEKSVMIGDRVDNDIRPAKLLGMRTIRVLCGLGALQEPKDEFDIADFTVKSLAEIMDLL